MTNLSCGFPRGLEEFAELPVEPFVNRKNGDRPSGYPPTSPSTRSITLSRDMVTSHVETLIERITGVDKAVSDHDGDYPVRYKDALYYVRVAGNDARPIVRVFSTVVADVEPSPDLYEAVNDINTRLGFCRCFWVNGQVLIETEHLGMTIKTEDFLELAENVASASDHFGPKLIERFGGKLAFDDSKGDAYVEPPTPGMYL
jgi:hypothetical protein